MNCTECKEKFVEYIEGLLPDNQKQEVETHLNNCRQCQAELDKLIVLGDRITSDAENKQSMDSTGSPQADFENTVFNRIVREQNKRLKQAAGVNRQLNIWRIIMKNKITKFAAAAAVVLIMLGGITIWPSRNVQNSKWWLEPSTAWGQEVLKSLDTIKTISCMEHTMLVRADGTAHVSRTWNKLYVSKDSYRKDIYDGNNLTETQWYVPDGNGMVQTSVRFDMGHYFVSRHVGGFGVADPVERMRFYVNLLDDADKLLGKKVIEGHECVGFEISADKYGSNPEQWVDSIWFDVKTKLPTCIEQRGRPVTDHQEETFTTVQDQFDYNPELSLDTFIPQIPEGYINHSDEIRAAKEKQ